MGILIGGVAGNVGENLHHVRFEFRLDVQWRRVDIGKFSHRCLSRGKMLRSMDTATQGSFLDGVNYARVNGRTLGEGRYSHLGP